MMAFFIYFCPFLALHFSLHSCRSSGFCHFQYCSLLLLTGFKNFPMILGAQPFNPSQHFSFLLLLYVGGGGGGGGGGWG